MKKKLLPFILGLSMIAATPLAAHADNDLPEQDSGNVIYDGFATINDDTSGDTDVITAIPECTMTIPADTTIKKGSLSANIGRVTIDGHYFVKPYYVELSVDKKDFTRVYEDGETDNNNNNYTGQRRINAAEDADHPTAKANQDIVFDVDTQSRAIDIDYSAGHEAYTSGRFVKNGPLNADGNNYTLWRTGYPEKACRRFWKDETLVGDAQVAKYNAGEVTDINGQENIFVNISGDQWLGTSEATKPLGGQYKGSITFTARFLDNYSGSNMAEWAAYPLT